jgi:integrase
MATIIKGKNARKPVTVRYFHENRQRERSFATEREAKDFIAKFEHDRRESIFVDPKAGQVMFIDYAGQWIDGLDRAAGTKTTYRSILNARLRPALAGRTLAQVANDREGIWSLISGMDLSSARRACALSVITGPCDEAVRAGRIAKHRLGGLSVRKDAQEPAVIIPATKAELAKLADGLRPELHLLVWLMLGCGLRISEALAVSLSNFRVNGRVVLRVIEQVGLDGKTAPLKARRRGEYRDVPVPGWLWTMVQAHVAEFGTDDGYVFGTGGRRIRYGNVQERFSTAVKNAGLSKDFTPHQLRHLYVSALLSAGVPITDVATWVGHRDIRVTHAVYGHLLPDSWTRGTEALEALAP